MKINTLKRAKEKIDSVDFATLWRGDGQRSIGRNELYCDLQAVNNNTHADVTL